MQEQEHVLLLSALLYNLKHVFRRTGLSAENFTNFLPERFQKAWDCIPSDHDSKIAHYITTADTFATGQQLPEEHAEVPIERLAPVANEVYLKKTPDDNGSRKDLPNYENYWYPLKPLSEDYAEFMPVVEDISQDQLRQEYLQLWEGFVCEIEQLREKQDFNAYFFTVYFLLKKYFSRVPSAFSDISVFDHARITTALAHGLYRYEHENGNHKQPEFLLIEGGISGIQKFIFNMVSPQQERARLTKRLRGRSFYLLLLAETIVDYLLKNLGLTISSQLWCSGGHFLIIAPNTPTVTYHLKACYQNINTFMVERFHGDLAAVLGSVKVSGDALRQDFAAVRQELAKALEREKTRKLHNVLQEKKNLQFVSEPSEGGDSYDKYVADLNREQEEIGERLTRLKTGGGKLVKRYKRDSEQWQDTPLVTFDLADDLHIGWNINPTRYAKEDTVYAINDVNFMKISPKNDVRRGFKFMAPYVDTYDQIEAERINNDLENSGNPEGREYVNAGDIKQFADLASAGSGGFLGVLRMDVDHLGAVFSIGLGEKNSLTRIAALSSDMDLFFSGYFQHLCRTDFTKDTYIAYSGGDDLFAIGSWDNMLDLACRVRDDFKAFTCHNDNLNISGGLFLCKGKYPIHRAAERARHLLDDLAKDNQHNELTINGKLNERNGIALFNHRLDWEDFRELRKFGEKLRQAIRAEKGTKTLNRAYLYKLLDLHNTWKTYRQLNVARLYYITIRNIENVALSQEILNKFQPIEDEEPIKDEELIKVGQFRKHHYLEHPGYIPILVGYTGLKTRK